MNLNPIEQIDLVVITFVFVVVVLTYLGLKRFFVRPLLLVIEQREEYLVDAEQRLLDAKEQEKRSIEESQAAIGQARHEAEQLLKEADEQAAAYRTQTLRKAADESSARLAEARRAMESERSAAMDVMRDRAVTCVTEACVRLQSPASADDIERAVDEALRSVTRWEQT